MDNKDKKRSNNFTKDEERILLSLIRKYKKIIECKKSGATTWKEKEKVWKKIEMEYRSLTGESRTAKTLKDKYANLKKVTKVKFSLIKQNSIKTGGGPPDVPNLTDIDESIKDLIGTQIDGLSCIYDSDTVASVTPEDKTLETETVLSFINDTDMSEIEETVNSDNLITVDGESEVLLNEKHRNVMNMIQDHAYPQASPQVEPWNSYSSSRLKETPSLKLTVNKGSYKHIDKGGTKIYDNLNSVLVKEKLDFVRVQKEKFLAEHQMKMEIYEKKIKIVG